MKTAALFQWVELKQDVPNSPVKAGDKGVVLDHLNSTKTQPEPGYILEIFQDGETLDVVSVPISWVNPLPETWGSLTTTHLLRSPKNAARLLTALERAKARTLKPQTINKPHQ